MSTFDPNAADGRTKVTRLIAVFPYHTSDQVISALRAANGNTEAATDTLLATPAGVSSPPPQPAYQSPPVPAYPAPSPYQPYQGAQQYPPAHTAPMPGQPAPGSFFPSWPAQSPSSQIDVDSPYMPASPAQQSKPVASPPPSKANVLPVYSAPVSYVSSWKVLRQRLDVGEQLAMLQQVHHNKHFTDKTYVRYAASRYVKWLRLKAKYPKENIAMTGEIEFMLHVHMIHPLCYQQMCLQFFGRTVDLATMCKRGDLARTAQLWQEMYGQAFQPNPHVKEQKEEQKREMKILDSKSAMAEIWATIGRDLTESVKSQAKFWKKIEKVSNFDVAQERYEKFFLLMTRSPDRLLVPTLAIDLMWHEHMRHPVMYEEDCKRLLGRTIDHNDDIPTKSLKSGYSTTGVLWKAAYGEDYIPKRTDAHYGACGVGIGGCGFIFIAACGGGGFGGGGCGGGGGGCGGGGCGGGGW